MKTQITRLSLLLLLMSCEATIDNKQPSAPLTSEAILVSNPDMNASGAYFTKNHNNESVLVWTEELPIAEEGHVVKYAVWNAEKTEFDSTIEVSSSKGCRAHDESMNKVAFKADGTAIVVYSKRMATPENRFAGALYYSQSFDSGNNWTDPNYLHVGDTTVGLSRSFFDLERLADGEIGAIWLDSRETKKRGDGSSLYFSKTDGHNGFVKDQMIGEGTCECCRTELFVASNGDVHATYRDIWMDTIRDMTHKVSTDNGQSFSKPQRISEDNWAINGCPHTGPSMGESAKGLHYAWYTMGGGAGIYYTTSNKKGDSFGSRHLLSASARHPQLLALEDENIVFVWEDGGQASSHAGHHGDTSTEVGTIPARSNSVIKAQLWQNNYPVLEYWVSSPLYYAEYPVITEESSEAIAIAWVQENKEKGDTYGVWFKRLGIGGEIK